MNAGELLIGLALIIPLFTAAVVYAVGRMPDVRETLTMVGAVFLAIITISLTVWTAQGNPPSLVVARPLQGLELAFRLEPLGALFALMASLLWGVNSMFSIGYMRGRREANQTRFYVCFALAMFGVMGIAMAANLFTLFVFYEVLTFATYPLVAHKGDEPSRRAGRIYLGILVGASVTLFLPGVIAVQVIAGGTSFVPGGLLAGKVEGIGAGLLLALLVFGSAKAALMPLHGWLPTAMVAPAPVSALLHAVAVVKAGVFVVLKVSAYIFGPELIGSLAAAQWLLWLAAASIVLASLIALTRDDLKARLAWSTVSQLAYVTSAALLPAGAGLVVGGLHMVVHAFGKITLFMCAGAIYVAAGVDKVSQMHGLGRRMPVTFFCFFVAALSVIGLPPFGGFWSKFLLISASFGSAEWITAAAMVLSSVLGLFYLAPVAIRGLLPPDSDGQPIHFIRPGGAPGIVVLSLAITAATCFALFFFADAIADFLKPVAGGEQ
ncbi:MAG TPA: proton-conducting transporter membrane subunit [Hyphomonadaceae bacterium]|nr:proton-conducting transporter membrane subunit [Hyphomonadaceae bacterium]